MLSAHQRFADLWLAWQYNGLDLLAFADALTQLRSTQGPRVLIETSLVTFRQTLGHYRAVVRPDWAADQQAVTALLAGVQAMTQVYRQFKDTGSSANGPTPLYDFADLTKLMGFEDIWEFEKRYAETK